jgi:hypothetical protein
MAPASEKAETGEKERPAHEVAEEIRPSDEL